MKISCVLGIAAVAIGTAMTVGCSGSKTAQPPVQTAPAANPSTLAVVSGQVQAPIRGAIVTLTPRGTEPTPPPPFTPVLDQVQLTFIPDLLIARAGFPMSFHSNDNELHNINVVKSEKRMAEFDRSIPPGGSFDHVFEESGFYDVRCNIHSGMSAVIFVASTPFAETVAADGAFVFENIPPGAYTLTVYNGAATMEKQVEIALGDNNVSLDGA